MTFTLSPSLCVTTCKLAGLVHQHAILNHVQGANASAHNDASPEARKEVGCPAAKELPRRQSSTSTTSGKPALPSLLQHRTTTRSSTIFLIILRFGSVTSLLLRYLGISFLSTTTACFQLEAICDCQPPAELDFAYLFSSIKLHHR